MAVNVSIACIQSIAWLALLSSVVYGQDGSGDTPTCPAPSESPTSQVCEDCTARPTWVILGICSGGGFLVGGFIFGFSVYCCCAAPARRKVGRIYLEQGGAGQFYTNPVLNGQDGKPVAAPRRGVDGSRPVHSVAPTPAQRGEIRSGHPRLGSVTCDDEGASTETFGQIQPRKFSKQLVQDRRDIRTSVLTPTSPKDTMAGWHDRM